MFLNVLLLASDERRGEAESISDEIAVLARVRLHDIERNLRKQIRQYVNSREKSRLPRGIEFTEITQADANEAKMLLRPQVHSLPHRQRNFSQFIAGGGRGGGRMAASKDFELTCLEFEDHRSGYP